MGSTIRTAVILAGGAGSRMWPYADCRNKCALPVANVPNVLRLARELIEAGITHLVVSTGAQPGSIRHALLSLGDRVSWCEHDPASGTATALLAALGTVTEDRFAVVFGDLVFGPGVLSDFLRTAAETEPGGAVLVDPMPAGEGGDWHAAEVSSGQVHRFVGHDADAPVRSNGAIVLDRSVMRCLEANPGFMRAVGVGGMPPAEADLWQSLNDWSAAIAAVQASGWVVDLDKPWHILNANRLAAQQMTAAISQTVVHPSARVSASARIEGAVSVGEGSEIGPGVLITGNAVIGARTRVTNGAILKGGSIVGDDTRISDYCHVNGETVVGNRCVVGHGAEMAGVVFDGAYLYHYCEVCGVVGLSVDIGAATVCGTLRFDDGEAVHRVKGRRERPSMCANATYFGDYSRTGVNVITTPGAKIGCYSCVGPGVVVYGDVASGKLVLLKQELIERDWGPQRYGW